MCSFLQAMASSCSPPHAASHPVTTSDVTVIVSDVLRRLVASGHLRPLVTALIDGIGDEFGSRGTGLVLAALLESRGSEESLKSHTGQLIWLKRSGRAQDSSSGGYGFKPRRFFFFFFVQRNPPAPSEEPWSSS